MLWDRHAAVTPVRGDTGWGVGQSLRPGSSGRDAPTQEPHVSQAWPCSRAPTEPSGQSEASAYPWVRVLEAVHSLPAMWQDLC